MAVIPRSTPRRPIREQALAHPEAWFAAGTFIVVLMAAMRLASSFFLPVVVSALLALLLAPVVRWLGKRGLPPGIASALVVISIVVGVGASVYYLARPAASWLGRANPETMTEARVKVQKILAPFQRLQNTASQLQAVTHSAPGNDSVIKTKVEVAPPGLLSSVPGTTIGFFGAASTVVFLTFFLLAAGERFSEKLGDIMPDRHRRQMIDGLRDMQFQMSRYLSTSAAIRVGLGVATWGAMALVGLPNPALWGVVAGVLNFIPYLGSLVALLLIGLASLITFDTTHQVVFAMGSFFLISVLEGNVVTPMLLGHRLPLNAVAIFVGLLFWGWLWGITGAVLAVPLTVLIKVIADRVEVLEPVAVLLDS
jgi:predicted PurR-regulated permease PerM